MTIFFLSLFKVQDHSLIAQLLLRDNNLLHKPGGFYFDFLAIFRNVSKTDTCDVSQLLGGELKAVRSASEITQAAA